jgi:hypothetical protein
MSITVRVTILSGDDVSDLKPLLERIRAKIAALTVVEAPKGIDYSYQFPVVAVSDQGRHFGDDAKDVLKRLAS